MCPVSLAMRACRGTSHSARLLLPTSTAWQPAAGRRARSGGMLGALSEPACAQVRRTQHAHAAPHKQSPAILLALILIAANVPGRANGWQLCDVNSTLLQVATFSLLQVAKWALTPMAHQPRLQWQAAEARPPRRPGRGRTGRGRHAGQRVAAGGPARGQRAAARLQRAHRRVRAHAVHHPARAGADGIRDARHAPARPPEARPAAPAARRGRRCGGGSAGARWGRAPPRRARLRTGQRSKPGRVRTPHCSPARPRRARPSRRRRRGRRPPRCPPPAATRRPAQQHGWRRAEQQLLRGCTRERRHSRPGARRSSTSERGRSGTHLGRCGGPAQRGHLAGEAACPGIARRRAPGGVECESAGACLQNTARA